MSLILNLGQDVLLFFVPFALSKWFNVLLLFFIEKGLLVYLIEKNEEGEKSFTFLNVR